MLTAIDSGAAGTAGRDLTICLQGPSSQRRSPRRQLGQVPQPTPGCAAHDPPRL